jgi:hypothetical protein
LLAKSLLKKIANPRNNTSIYFIFCFYESVILQYPRRRLR